MLPAPDFQFEVGDALGIAGLRRDPQKPKLVQVAHIKGELVSTLDSSGRRQFTGRNPAGFWLERGSSGSPVFLENAVQLAGIFSLSELGANEGTSHLHEAFVVRGMTIRLFVARLIGERAAKAQHLDLAALKPVLDALGAQDIPLAEIPDRLRQFVEAAKTHAAEPVRPSNDGADIEAVIGASRDKLRSLDTAGARAVLQAKIAEEEAARTRRLVPLLRERASVERLAFDHKTAKSTLAEITSSSPDDVWA